LGHRPAAASYLGLGERVGADDLQAARTLVDMVDSEDRAQSEVTDPILDEHADVRRRFEQLWNRRASGDEGALDLAAAWQSLAKLLQSHTSAASTVAAPDPLKDSASQTPARHGHLTPRPYEEPDTSRGRPEASQPGSGS
jgi:hypothetical protein